MNRRRLAVLSAGAVLACGLALVGWGIGHRRAPAAAVAPVAIDSAANRVAAASTPVAPPPTVVSPKPVAPPLDLPANERAPLALTKSTARSSSARPARRRAPTATPPDVAAKTTSPNVQSSSDRIWDEQ